MRRIAVSFVLLTWWAGVCLAQQPAVPQTARQALLEMFFSKTSGTFVKHLPVATRAALEKAGAMASLQQYSLLTAQLQTQQSNFQTFDTGSVLLSGQDPKTGQKMEVTLENDTLRGDVDDLVLSFAIFKDGKVQRTAYMPLITFSMKQEAHIWKLNEISITVHLPLADPELLKAITEKMKPQVEAQAHVQVQPTTFAPRSEVQLQPAGSDAMVIGAMKSILTAESTYSQTYSNVGYTCMLSDLDGFGGGEPNAHQAMLINSGLASGKRYGFVFTLSECSGAPATKFHLSAVSNGESFQRKAFCADQSGVIRSSDDGNAGNCFAHGTPVQ